MGKDYEKLYDEQQKLIRERTQNIASLIAKIAEQIRDIAVIVCEPKTKV